MALARPDEALTVEFLVDADRFSTEARRGHIVHEAFHRALPNHLTVGHRLTFQTESGREIFADNFLGDLADTFGSTRIVTQAIPIRERTGVWRNIGFDHLAITVADRVGARDFMRDVLQMEVMRDDAHLTVMATGPTALFLFDAGTVAPLSDGSPSRWHHIGFVVDDLEAAYAHLRQHQDRFVSDFTMLERDERWSLYCFYRNGDVTFMIQLSEIKVDARGFHDPSRSDFPHLLYDYASRPYGLSFPDHVSTTGAINTEDAT